MEQTDIVSELLIGDEIVTVTVHLIEGLDDVDGLYACGNECRTDLVALETAELGTLRLEDVPEWLTSVVVEQVISFNRGGRKELLRLSFDRKGSGTSRCPFFTILRFTANAHILFRV